MEAAFGDIERDLFVRVEELRAQNKLVEAQRLEQRTNYDLEMMREIGYCSGVENYSRYFDGRAPAIRPIPFWTTSPTTSCSSSTNPT